MFYTIVHTVQFNSKLRGITQILHCWIHHLWIGNLENLHQIIWGMFGELGEFGFQLTEFDMFRTSVVYMDILRKKLLQYNLDNITILFLKSAEHTPMHRLKQLSREFTGNSPNSSHNVELNSTVHVMFLEVSSRVSIITHSDLVQFKCSHHCRKLYDWPRCYISKCRPIDTGL